MAEVSYDLVLNILKTPLIWVVIVGGSIIIVFGVLRMKKAKQLFLPCLVFIDIGRKKVHVQLTRAGWFKSKPLIMGLFGKGEESLKTKDGRTIQGGSSVDYQEFNGKSAIFVKRKDNDPKILVPISKIENTNDELLTQIAPADYRDASNDILRSAENEMKGKWEKIVEWILLGGIIIFALVSIIIITQMVSRGQKEAADLILEAGRIVSGAQPPTSGAI